MSLDPVEAFASGLLSALSPSGRRELARVIARRLLESQQKRISAQMNPDGTPFDPRKPQLRHTKGRIRQEMFVKLRTNKFMKAKATPDAAIVTFTDVVQRIARVHQLGLRDKVNKAGLEAQYPERRLLGISAEDETLIADVVNAELARRL